jgi:DNA-binding MarR family transcriptional regulator
MPTDRTREDLLEEIYRVITQFTWRERREFLELIRPYALTLSQITVLVVAHREHRPMPLRELCDLALTPPSSMTHTIDRLVEEELMVRTAHPNDRRTILVSLTPSGTALVEEILAVQKAHFRSICEGLADEDLERFLDVYTKLDEYHTRRGPHPPADRSRRRPAIGEPLLPPAVFYPKILFNVIPG